MASILSVIRFNSALQGETLPHLPRAQSGNGLYKVVYKINVTSAAALFRPDLHRFDQASQARDQIFRRQQRSASLLADWFSQTRLASLMNGLVRRGI